VNPPGQVSNTSAWRLDERKTLLKVEEVTMLSRRLSH
jgi:hypothetical protein